MKINLGHLLQFRTFWTLARLPCVGPDPVWLILFEGGEPNHVLVFWVLAHKHHIGLLHALPNISKLMFIPFLCSDVLASHVSLG